MKQKRQQIEDYTNQVLQSVFIEMFGNPIVNEKGWIKKRISEVAKPEKHAIKAGPFGSTLKKSSYTSEGYKIYGQLCDARILFILTCIQLSSLGET